VLQQVFDVGLRRGRVRHRANRQKALSLAGGF